LKHPMTRLGLPLTLAALALAPAASHAQVFGQFTGAEPLATNARMFGAYLQTSENTFGVVSQLRLSFYPNIDFGFQGGLTRLDYVGGDRSVLKMGADLKFGIVTQSEQQPFSIAAGGGIAMESGDDYNVLTLAPSVVASRRFPMGQSAVTPYAGLGFAFSGIDVGESDDTDFSIPLRLGALLGIGSFADLVGEVQLQLGDSFNDDLALVVGANFPF
jgi:hypothetical protein